MSIAPSILAADFARLGAEVAEVAPVVPSIHVDVMDGHYVPNITLGHPVVASLRRATDRQLDCHLMITDPAVYGPQLVDLGADSITFHPEVEDDPLALVHRLHEQGARVGVAIKPAHPVSMVTELLPHVDLLLVMTVEPGFGGQSFLAHAVPKVAEAAIWRREHDARFRIQVDGGIAAGTIDAPAAAGAEIFVAGSSVFGAADRAAACEDLLARARAAAWAEAT
ncbi:MAG: ribulose-phosphate 3-epimerase [Nitriliruptor sp.]|nr:MAG: ribulose-phosphate 3-epimerase [Nitriliruptor sp.]